MKRKTIEEKAIQAWGTTNVPKFCTYLLINGEMLNGSYEGYRRDIDHREINEFMPVVNKSQIERMVSMCGASLPAKFSKMMQKYENNPEALRDAGIAYAINQIVDLLADGVDGIHLYTMNNSYVAKKISEAVSGLIGSRKK